MKKICNLLFLVLITILMINNVEAKMLSINDVYEDFRLNINDAFDYEGISSIYTGLDGISKKITVSINSTTILLNYTDEYIEYTEEDTNLVEEKINEYIIKGTVVDTMVYTIFEKTGHANENLHMNQYLADSATTNVYDEYGLLMDLQDYDFSHGSGSSSIEYSNHTKISLNTDKIDALFTKYGGPEEPTISKITLTASDIKENSVMLYPKTEYTTEVGKDYVSKCYIYRSGSIDGTFEKISNVAVNCSGNVGLKDDNIASGVTYYYKATSEDGKISSEVIKITTKATTTNDKNTVDTGASLPIIGVTVMMIGGILIYTKSKKKTLFNRL